MHDIYIGIISLISLCLPVELSPGNDSDGPVFRVVNGSVAKLGEFPYQVAVRRPKVGSTDYHTFCGGAILREEKVLTAAHCVIQTNLNICDQLCCIRYKKRSLENLYVVAATLKSSSSGPTNTTEQWRPVADMIIPSGYNFPKRDIALIITKAPFMFNEYVGSLPTATVPMDYGRVTCVVAGYGRVSEAVRSPVLMWAYLDLIPKEECRRIHLQPMKHFVCTQSYFTDVLQGDSGGPLVCMNTTDPADLGKGVIVGVVSGSREGAGTFFTRVTSYLDFIDGSRAAATELPLPSFLLSMGIAVLQIYTT